MARESSDEEVDGLVVEVGVESDTGYVEEDRDIRPALAEHLAAGLRVLAEPERLPPGRFKTQVESAGSGEEGRIPTGHPSLLLPLRRRCHG